MLSKRLMFALLIAGLSASPLLASAAAKTAQQQRMAQCSAQNKGKTGEAYKAAQKSCLSGSSATAGSSSQQRMKDCNAKASGKKGDERKQFMSSCLKAG